MEIKELEMSYEELTTYLQSKYGLPERAYFRTPTCKSKSPITRGSEGLYIHHIKETETDNLAQSEIAIEHPWDYQLPENLCYCDLLEHLLLHVHINAKRCKNANGFLIDGIINHLIPELNHIYRDNPIYSDPKSLWRNAAKEKIIKEQENYLLILSKWCDLIKDYIPNREFNAAAFLDFEFAPIQDPLARVVLSLTNIGFYYKLPPKPKFTVERSDGKQYYSVEDAMKDLTIPRKRKSHIRNQIHSAIHFNTKVQGYYWKKI